MIGAAQEKQVLRCAQDDKGKNFSGKTVAANKRPYFTSRLYFFSTSRSWSCGRPMAL